MLINKLSTKVQRWQKALADKLSHYESGLSPDKKKVMLALFCLLFGAASVFVIITAISKKFSRADALVAPISIPYHIGKNLHQPGVVIDSETYTRVDKFKLYLDSLKMNDRGQYMEIISTRPHLMDSILEFEKLYFTQFKK